MSPTRRTYVVTALAALPNAVLTTLIEHAAEPPLPWLNATIEFYAGPINRVRATETAFPHREARYQLIIAGASDDPADDETAIAWARQLYAATEPHSLNGAFLNFNTVDGLDRPKSQGKLRGQLGPLGHRKRRYDPTNLFPGEQQHRARSNLSYDIDVQVP